MKYYAVLYNANQTVDNPRMNKLDFDAVKIIINNKADDIIKSEFTNEYNKVFLNLGKVLLAFYNQHVILKVEELFEILSKTPFITMFAFDCEEIISKINLLYELGVLGLKLLQKWIKSKSIGSEWCFIFNEGIKPLEELEFALYQDTADIRLVLNPIFSKNCVWSIIQENWLEFLEKNI